MRSQLSCLALPLRRGTGLPYALAALACILVSAVAAATTGPWRICEVYSNADGSSQFIQLCQELSGIEQHAIGHVPVAGRTLVASDGAMTNSYVFPASATSYYNSHRLLVATQGFADLNLVKPDFVVADRFVPIPAGTISFENYDSVSYAGLPSDGFHAIDTTLASRPGNGDPSNAVTLATAGNFNWESYGFSGPRYADAGGRWVETGSMNDVRTAHTATLLPNGKVLVAGGAVYPRYPSFEELATAELYDPSDGTWSATGRMNTAKSGHSATLLPNGKVLVVGFSAADAELYDPTAGTWTVIVGPLGNLGNVNGRTATLLKSGRVLVAGGPRRPYGSPVASFDGALLYDPATNAWSNTTNFSQVRDYGEQATLLHDGRVLVTGGTNDPDYSFPLRSAETYDPISGSWSSVAPLHFGRIGGPAIRLQDGRILVVGGITELFDPATGEWSITGPPAGSFDSAVMMFDGKVLVTGGFTVDTEGRAHDTNDAEVYDPRSGRWMKAAGVGTSRSGHTMTLLGNGKVLIAGGVTGLRSETSRGLRSAELFDSGPGQVALGAGFTGSWFNPAQSGHGFMLEVLPGTPLRLLASWFTFAPQGGLAWITGVGPIDGNQAVVQGYQMLGTGGRFPPNFDAANVHQQEWGTLTFTFSDCTHGRVEWMSSAPGYGNGGMDLTRLTMPAGLTCTAAGTGGAD